MWFAGIDPTASPQTPSGVCLLNESLEIVFLGKCKGDREILQVLQNSPEPLYAVGIDGPLQPPHELQECCFRDDPPTCSHSQTTPYKGRYCEYLLTKNGFRCFPTSKNSFARRWIWRCFQLNQRLQKAGFTTLEVYPTATRKILFPQIRGKKQRRSTREALQQALRQTGVRFPAGGNVYSHDELDALLAAYTVLLLWQGKTVAVGDPQDGYIILPAITLRFPDV